MKVLKIQEQRLVSILDKTYKMQQAPVHILLVDDDEINNFLSKELLRLHQPDLVIESLQYVDEALLYLENKITNKQPLPDIILVDINMPSLNGWDFMDAYEKMNAEAIKNVKVYIYTSSIYYKDLEKIRNYKSVIKLISKPFTDEMITEMLGIDAPKS